MTKGRIEAFSDGMFAIIITVMVLELQMPKVTGWLDFAPIFPNFASYALCFAVTGAYWAKHHAMFHKVKVVGGWVVPANLNMLFWLSLMPFFTGVIGEDNFNGFTTLLYSFEFMMCAVSFYVLVLALRAAHKGDSAIPRSMWISPRDRLCLSAYVLAVPLSLYFPRTAIALIAITALVCILPDRMFTAEIPKG